MVGAQRLAIVDGLQERFNRVCAEGKPQFVCLSAPIGWGKTRLVHEFYKRLAAAQPPPAYWPPTFGGNPDADSGVSSSADPLTERKRTHPLPFPYPAGSEMPWMWWGISCHKRSDGRPAQALADDATQIAAHVLAMEARRNGPLRRLLNAGDLRSASGLLAAGSTALDIIGCFAAIAPPVAIGQVGAGIVMDAWKVRRKYQRERRAHEERSEPGHVIDPENADRREFVGELSRQISRSASELPWIIVLDDLHDADESLRMFVEAALEIEGQVFMLGTTWPDQLTTDTPTGQWIERICDGGNEVTMIDVPELTRQDFRDLVLSQAPRTDPAVAEAFVRRFYPNPFALLQAMTFRLVQRSLRDEAIRLAPEEVEALDSELEDQYRRKWRELPEAIQDVLTVAAFQGRSYIEECAARAAMALQIDEALRLLDTCEYPYAWTRQVDELVAAFVEPDLHHLAMIEGSRALSREDRKRVASTVAEYVLARKKSDDEWESLTPTARETVLTAHLRLVREGYVEASENSMDSALRLARLQRAKIDYTQALATLDAALESGDRGAQLAELQLERAQVLRLLGRLEEAEEAADAALEIAEEVGSKGLALRAQIEAATTIADGGDYERADARLGDEWRQVEDTEFPDEVCRAANLAARLEAERGRFSMAETEAAHALETAQRLRGPESPEALEAMGLRSWALSRLGRNQEAKSQAETALRALASVLGPDDPETIDAKNNVARFTFRLGDQAEAIRMGREVREAYARALGQSHPKALIASENLATYLSAAGEFDEAAEIVAETLSAWRETLGLQHPKAFAARRTSARLKAEAGDVDQAIGELRELQRDAAEVLGPGHPNTLRVSVALAELLGKSGETGEAVSVAEAGLASADSNESPEATELSSLIERFSAGGGS